MRPGRGSVVKSFENRVAAITGAGSGIGRALAVELGRQKCDVALSDVNEQGLLETVEQVRGLGVHVTSRRVDVADREAVHAWADEVVDEHGKANLIFNNAGVALASTVEGMSYGVSASSVHPGGIKTGIARSSRIDSSVRDLGISDIDSRERFEKTFITGADKAARVILDGVRRNRRRILVGPDARVFDWVVRLLPSTYQRITIGYSKFSAK